MIANNKAFVNVPTPPKKVRPKSNDWEVSIKSEAFFDCINVKIQFKVL